MLITKEIKRYSKKISIKDLPLNSHKKVLVKCDNCGEIKEVKYQSYNLSTNNNTEKFFCNKKDCINKKRKKAINKKYGINNVFQLCDIKDELHIS